MRKHGWHYHLLKDVTLEINGETTQIDHILISVIGIFVIETKNIEGWIFGTAKNKIWTKSLYGKKHRFMNPLHQNYKHCLYLNRTFSRPEKLNSLVVFIDVCDFKTDIPENVIYLRQINQYMDKHNSALMTPEKCDQLANKVKETRLEEGYETDLKHREKLRKRHKNKNKHKKYK